jgi:crotonobetainyl-CoA:carnitine CoA-transferase CaiB-like acyl-CoA transferase
MARTVALKGVRIVDLSIAIAGPSGSQLLGDLGAEVIKIEPPGAGEIARDLAPKLKGESYYILAHNRNKKDVALDLYTEAGKEALHDLVKISDVVYDNLRPGTLERLGADFETVRKINPRIISCSLTGYGSSGPYRDYPGFDDMAEGLSGVYSLNGEPGGRPMRVPVTIADLAGGFFAATGVIAALYDREHTGLGRKVEVNLLDAVMYYLSAHFQFYFTTGEVPRPHGSRHPTTPMAGIFQTRNGYLVLGPSWPRIARVINKEWMIDDPRFSTAEERVKNKKDLEDLIEDGLRQADTEDWLELMHLEDIACAPVYTLDKVVNDPQIVHNKTITTLHHPLCGEIRGIDCPIKIREAKEVEHSPPPTLGQHTDEVLKEILGYSEEKVRRLKEEEGTAEDIKARTRRRL